MEAVTQVRGNTRRLAPGKACHRCHQKRIRCDLGKPCKQCAMAGRLCTYSDVEIGACFACIRGKRKCDRQRPCGRCVQRGKGDDCCGPEAEEAVSSLPDKAMPDTLTVITKWDTTSSPEMEADSDWAGEVGFVSRDQTRLEFPIPFPRSGSTTSPLPFWRKLPPTPVCNYPSSFLAMICAIRQDVVQTMLGNMTPRLRTAVQTIFSALDDFRRSKAALSPSDQIAGTALAQWDDLKSWQHSARCGYSVSAIHPESGTMAFRNANDYWIDISGMHREEFFARVHNSQMCLPTSELRTFCKLVQSALDTLPETYGGNSTRSNEIVYRHIRKGWGKDDGWTEGILTRQCTQFKYSGSSIRTVSQSCTVISPEEYDHAANVAPEACEWLASVVVGRKSGRTLVDRSTVATESFAFLNATEEGRGGMDKLADTMEKLFSKFVQTFAPLHRFDSAPPAQPQQLLREQRTPPTPPIEMLIGVPQLPPQLPLSNAGWIGQSSLLKDFGSTFQGASLGPTNGCFPIGDTGNPGPDLGVGGWAGQVEGMVRTDHSGTMERV